MHKRNLNHSELYLLTTTLYLSNTPPPPTPTMNITFLLDLRDQRCSLEEKQSGTSPLIFLLAESTQHISPIEQPIMPAYTTHEGQSFTLAYLFIALDAHTRMV